jgi:molecular chaperone DnaK
MEDFKDQVDKTEADTVSKLVTELREIAVKGQAGDASVTADSIREAINKTQTASLGLFSKVYEKKAAEEAAKNASASSDADAKPSEEGEKKN